MIVEIIPTRRPSIVVLVKPNMNISDRKNRVFYLIPVSIQPNVGDLRYFKLWIVLDQIIQVLKYQRFSPSDWNDIWKGFHHQIETI